MTKTVTPEPVSEVTISLQQQRAYFRVDYQEISYDVFTYVDYFATKESVQINIYLVESDEEIVDVELTKVIMDHITKFHPSFVNINTP